MNYEAHKYQLLLKYTNTIYVYCNTVVGSRKSLLPPKSSKYYIVCVCVSVASMQRACAVLYCHMQSVWL